MVAESAELVRKMILAGTAPGGGEDVPHLDAPEIKSIFYTFTGHDPWRASSLRKVRLGWRRPNRSFSEFRNVGSSANPPPRARRAPAQIAAFRAWEQDHGERFDKVRFIKQPCLVVKRRTRYHDPRKKLVYAGRTPPEGHPDRLSRRRPRSLYFSTAAPLSHNRGFFNTDLA